jgi:hypothetical protein
MFIYSHPVSFSFLGNSEFLTCFSYFEKIEVGLWDHLAAWVSVPPPPNNWQYICMLLGTSSLEAAIVKPKKRSLLGNGSINTFQFGAYKTNGPEWLSLSASRGYRNICYRAWGKPRKVSVRLKSSISWYITSCSLVKANQFMGTSPQSSRLKSKPSKKVTLSRRKQRCQPWRWRWYIPLKHGVTSQKMELFITTDARPSDRTQIGRYLSVTAAPSCSLRARSTWPHMPPCSCPVTTVFTCTEPNFFVSSWSMWH